MENHTLCVVLLLSVLLIKSFGASPNVSSRIETASNDIDVSSSSPSTFTNWGKNIWSSITSNLHSNWYKVANGTIDTFNAVSSEVKDGWDQVANSTVQTFEKVYPQIEEGWSKMTISDNVNTFEAVSSLVKEGLNVANETFITTHQTATNGMAFFFSNFYCPASFNESEACNNTNMNCTLTSTASNFIDDEEAIAIQRFACATLKSVKVVGIAMSGGFFVALLGPVIFYVALYLTGFTFYGVIAGSAAACCQSRIGNVAAGSCFAMFQSIGTQGLSGVCYWPIFALSWIVSGLLIGYLIWPYF